MSVIGYFSKPYVVEVGTDEHIGYGHTTVTAWEFERGFDDLAEAEAYAREVSPMRAHVPVVDRTEEAW